MPQAYQSAPRHQTPPITSLSNLQADIAERAGAAYRTGGVKTREAAAAYLAAGRALAEGRDACRGSKGAWSALLARAGIPATTARLLVRVSRSGMSAETLARTGVRGAAALLRQPSKRQRVAGFAGGTGDGADGGKPVPKPPSRYRLRRAAGACADCGGGAQDGRSRCPACAAKAAARGQETRARARKFDALAPRLAEAARAGTGLVLDAATVKTLAGAAGRD